MDFSDATPGKFAALSLTWGPLTRLSDSSITTLYYCTANSDTFVPRWLRSAVACYSSLLHVQQFELLSVSVSSQLIY